MKFPVMLRAFAIAVVVLSSAAAADAQVARTPAPAAPRQPPPAATTPTPAPQASALRLQREGQPVNIKVELTITDQQPGAAPRKKTVSVVTGDMLSGAIRSQTDVAGVGPVPLNVDVDPVILSDNKIRVRFNLQYDLPVPMGSGGTVEAGKTTVKMAIHDSMSVILENGKAITVAQSADPITERQVTVEVKATILR